ncbi:MAG: TIGR03557 family F420-dependent LLM class oxidoreductase [Actinobacteria bacterium]|nr:TIGR03557 family F420-dependent LLM class oxidoreductase [Actinomycetota bacterium]
MRDVEIGFWLSSEEHSPGDLVRMAVRAEDVGFPSAMISDHFHPWVPAQGQSPFVWAVLGGVAERTERLRVGTGVTASIQRTHPAIVAQAAATVTAMMPGRFFLGLGSGERLNEHIVGDRWPPVEQRREMLEEAVEVIRTLFTGEEVTHRGRYFTVEDARLYTLPAEPPPIMLAASGPRAAQLAGRVADGFVGTSPSAENVKAFAAAGGAGKPRYGQVHLCWAESEHEARKTAREWWPNAGFSGALSTELARPAEFESVAELVTEEQVAAAVPCGPDPEPVVAAVTEYVSAGYDHVYLHQVGPDQEGFFRFWERELSPRLNGR